MDDQIRAMVLKAGEQALREHGFFGVSLRQIAQEVGVHPSSIGHHFGGKKGLLSAIELAAQTRGG